MDIIVHPVLTITVDVSSWCLKSRSLGSGRGCGLVKPLEMCVSPKEKGGGDQEGCLGGQAIVIVTVGLGA